MKKLISIAIIGALLGGCTLTGMNRSSVNARSGTSSPAATPAYAGHGDEHYNGTERDEARDAVVSKDNTVPARVRTYSGAFDEGMSLHAEGKLREARLSLTAALNDNLSSANEEKALSTLREINSKIFLTAETGGDLKLYVIQNGDSLGKIANSHNTTVEMLQRINGLTGTMIREGRTLKVLSGNFELVVRRSRYLMDLLLDGAFIQRYDVGLGTDGATPLGDFTVKNRLPKPADGSYAYGHEKHRLGTRWLGLSSAEGHKGYGIHGCRPEEEKLIPGACSQGCVRMRNTEVEEIFDIVPVGTKLTVIEK
jgi:LysM repeat protein